MATGTTLPGNILEDEIVRAWTGTASNVAWFQKDHPIKAYCTYEGLQYEFIGDDASINPLLAPTQWRRVIDIPTFLAPVVASLRNTGFTAALNTINPVTFEGRDANAGYIITAALPSGTSPLDTIAVYDQSQLVSETLYINIVGKIHGVIGNSVKINGLGPHTEIVYAHFQWIDDSFGWRRVAT